VALIVLDASVVIGHLSARDVHHEAAASALLARAGDDLRLPSSAFAELLVEPERREAGERARALIHSLDVVIDPIGEPTAIHAARLRARHPSLRLPDALVIAHADALDADEVLTTDTRWRRFSRRVRVVR
jgi:predicted nucleic acid-binding protein